MKLKFVCPYWGQEGISGNDFVEKVILAGYDGAEINFPDDSSFQKSIVRIVDSGNFDLIAQQWLPPKNEKVVDYKKRFTERLKFLADFSPVFINSHTGKDFFSFNENCQIIDEAFEFQENSGIKIVHETHRGRFNFASFSTIPFLKKYDNLYLNADFSHWCNVSESFLEDQQDSIKLAISQSHYIHARIGHTQSAQVNDPFAPEWEIALQTFVNWWKQILKKAEARGDKVFYICPEFGPFPYMPYLPYTKMPVNDQWQINIKMMNFLRKALA